MRDFKSETEKSGVGDRQLVAMLTRRIGADPEVEYNDAHELIVLSLARLHLTQLPPEVTQLTHLQQLNLSGNQLTRLPLEIARLNQLRQLELSDNKLAELPPEIGNLTQLQQLDLSENRLSQFPAEIAQLPQLQQLDLSGNQLTQLPPEIEGMLRLRQLSLGGNRLSQLPAQIGKLAQLQVIHLVRNQLTQLPAEFGQLTQLQQLDLSENRLSQFPAEFGQLTQLQHLDLSENRLSQFPAEIAQLPQLQQLDLSGNQLTQLPPEIEGMLRLRQLSLGGNRLSQLPAQIGKLAQLQVIHLVRNQLTQLPAEFGQLTQLQQLYLSENRLSHFPAEIAQLPQLQQLDLSGNQLTQLPPEIEGMLRLRQLSLGGNRLSQLPAQIGKLAQLQVIHLVRNQLTQLPAEFGQLTQLQHLDLSGNQLTQLPAEIGQLTRLRVIHLVSNQLIQLPAEFGQLTQLQQLNLSLNQLTQLPAEIGQLTQLQQLDVSGNRLTQLPAEIGQLTQLPRLDLSGHQLTRLPPEFCQLTQLQQLSLSGNRLTQLPAEFGQLTQLQQLDLSGNQLTQLPAEFGQLTQLQQLDLSGNQLTQLPAELGQLTQLQELYLNENLNLLSPPPEVVALGTGAVIAFLQDLQANSRTRYEVKVLLVGEGGTGKSSLLRALRGEEFDPLHSTTHGIEVDHLSLPHPDKAETEILLNTWDFGGQQIYHATHQFFLTKRSLYLLLWNARLGAEQARLNYWLSTIQALASEAPIVLVATHIDERAPDVNYPALKEAYPQLVGNLRVSNKTGEGVQEVLAALREQAAKLPLMGQPWPQAWLTAENALVACPEHHINADEYAQRCAAAGVEPDLARGDFGSFLHDLGKILYFQDDDILCNLVVLKPNWITKAISRVLADEPTRAAKGILSHADLPRIWERDDQGRRYDRRLYPTFLRLMERFDLSYQIEADTPGDHPTRSLVPQLLPFEPPGDLPIPAKAASSSQGRVEMIYRLNFVPAGVMSWFLVRTHRYTRSQHWRDGAVLEYEGHLARVELNPTLREIRLVVWGAEPHNFFTILKETMDLILRRFEGLKTQCLVPCNCHRYRNVEPACPHLYPYEELVRRWRANRSHVECPENLVYIPLPELLYGIHALTDQEVMVHIREGLRRIEDKFDEERDLILEQLKQQSELIARNFTRQWNLQMADMEVECPNTFLLMPGEGGLDWETFDPRNWASKQYRLYLVCQHPTGPHMWGEGYTVRQPKEWWATVSPWFTYLIRFFQFALPMGRALGSLYDEKAVDRMKNQLGLMEEISKHASRLSGLDTMKSLPPSDLGTETPAVGPALRALHGFLNDVDPQKNWRGLHKTITPDGNILWLCGEHRRIYEPKPLTLP